jgi:hypothetical protein
LQLDDLTSSSGVAILHGQNGPLMLFSPVEAGTPNAAVAIWDAGLWHHTTVRQNADASVTVTDNGAAPAVTNTGTLSLPAAKTRTNNHLGLFPGGVPFSGYVGELIVYSAPISDASNVALQAYLKLKYGLSK